ncbi:hypothetical protein J5X84_35695 [Streptosporangiaceae bacterium NEAU-GS5]|nr:hypothetical protein [Streptosporangiaceae bacterium NEAU-GS5]
MKRFVIVLAAVLLMPLAPAHAESGHFTGALADGSTWVADVPAEWNGTLLLYSHGFGPLIAQDAPSPAVAAALLARGYALAGSSYDPDGSWWALGSAVEDQLDTATAVAALAGRPKRVIAFGTSMGGLISARIAETGRVDGALTTCGIVAGGVDLNAYQLTAEYTLARLLAPSESIRLTGFATQADASATGAILTQLLKDAQATPAGRARIALAAAYLNQSAWFPGMDKPGPRDYGGQEAQQYQWMTSVLNFVVGGRYWIELAAGGDSGWTAGVDFARLLRESPHFAQVAALYRSAGSNLRADLADLTSHAAIPRDREALGWMLRTSTPTGRLHAPELNLHTISDQLVPVEQERAYASRVTRPELLRQAFVDRAGHCAFTTAELVAGVDAVQNRVVTGRWGDVTAAGLNRAAAALGLDGGMFLPYRPPHLVTP